MTLSTSAVTMLLLLQIAQLIEQPRVLDGDDGLIGERPSVPQSACPRAHEGAARTTLSAPMASPPRIIGMIVIAR